jgi:hypothetical protein
MHRKQTASLFDYHIHSAAHIAQGGPATTGMSRSNSTAAFCAPSSFARREASRPAALRKFGSVSTRSIALAIPVADVFAMPAPCAATRAAFPDKAGVMTDALAVYCTRKGRFIVFDLL